MSKGMKTCDICGRDFALIKEEHYVARAIMRNGEITAALTGQDEAEMYDAFDCPHCGCQNIVQVRKIAMVIENLDGCDSCKWFDKGADESPCSDCIGTHTYNYEKRED